MLVKKLKWSSKKQIDYLIIQRLLIYSYSGIKHSHGVTVTRNIQKENSYCYWTMSSTWSYPLTISKSGELISNEHQNAGLFQIIL